MKFRSASACLSKCYLSADSAFGFSLSIEAMKSFISNTCLLSLLFLVSVCAFAAEDEDQTAYCNYQMEQAMAQRDLLRTPNSVAGVTQPDTGTPSQLLWGLSNSLSNDRKSGLVMTVARKNCELYRATTTTQQHIQYALPGLEKQALRHRLSLIQETYDKLDSLIAKEMKLVSAQTLTRPTIYPLQGTKVHLAASRAGTLLALTSLYAPDLGDTSVRELISEKQNSEVKNQEAVARLNKQNNWDIALSVGVRHQLSPFLSPSVEPYGTASITYNLGSRAINRHLDNATRAYAEWKTVQEGDVARNAEILKRQIIEGIEVQQTQLSALLDEDREIEANLQLVAGVETSTAAGFRNQLTADKLVLGIDIGDTSFRLEKLRAYLRKNF